MSLHIEKERGWGFIFCGLKLVKEVFVQKLQIERNASLLKLVLKILFDVKLLHFFKSLRMVGI